MASYDTGSEEFSKMQEEALRRLEEMRRRSRTVVGNSEAPSSEAPREADSRASAERAFSSSENNNEQHLHNNLNGNNHMQLSEIIKSVLGDGIKLDTDRILILALLFMLYKNKADIKLLAALAYLMF